MTIKTLNIDLNRVEGDLEFELDIDNEHVVDARCKGIMYRGFEQLLIDREARDSIVITPRVCGICGTAHMYCAVTALEKIWNIQVPDNARRIRNLCLMVENLQSDLRQSFLMFTPDFCNDAYQQHALYPDLLKAFEPFKGRIYRSILEQSKNILKIVAIWGGQWPHSSYMVPGGVSTGPSIRRIIDSFDIIDKVTQYIENELLQGSSENFLSLSTFEELLLWGGRQRKNLGAFALFNEFARAIDLHKIGRGSDNMLSYGAYPGSDGSYIRAAGFYDAKSAKLEVFDQKKIAEHVKHSWYHPYDGGLHPFKGETKPNYHTDGLKYSWAKAPRYDNKVVQTGPLAEYIVDENPLFTDIKRKEGTSTWLRQFARLYRIVDTAKHIKAVLSDLKAHLNDQFFLSASEYTESDGQAFGLTQAARGCLGHWVIIKNGKIARYQIVTPTAWNASPKDSDGKHGHWEKSVLGLPVPDPDNPITIGHIVRSHDPCLVCTVHMVGQDNTRRSRRYAH